MQREWKDYDESFLSNLMQGFFRIIMVFMAYYDLEIHQMDVKMAFLNGDLYENVYMTQPKGFVMEEKEPMGCRL